MIKVFDMFQVISVSWQLQHFWNFLQLREEYSPTYLFHRVVQWVQNLQGVQ